MKKITLILLMFSAAQAFAAEGEKKLPDESLYQVKSVWTNQEGKKARLDQLRGHKIVIAMVYLGCKFSCPVTVTKMQDIEKNLTPEQKKSTQFVLVSFDPERDTPKAMRAFAKKLKLGLPPWNFLTTPLDSDIRELAALLDFKYKKAETGEFDHSFIITVLDEDGVIKGKLEGLSLKPLELLKFL